ncbi:MAG: hypothetical protein K1X92_06380 [Bacteroidia bacterium]|nr:hypothetical protein [Bacteroidia bacterium]
MAYISERFNRYGEAIFFLRKTAIEYGDKEAEERIHILMDKSGLEGVMADDRLGYYDYINRNTLYIVLTLIFVTALLGLYYWKSRNIKVLKNLFGLLIADAIIISGLIYSNYLMPARCVIISNTAFYESPSYASQSKTEAPVPGSIMKIKEKKDIWCEVSLNNKNYWIPFFTVREF